MKKKLCDIISNNSLNSFEGIWLPLFATMQPPLLVSHTLVELLLGLLLEICT